MELKHSLGWSNWYEHNGAFFVISPENKIVSRDVQRVIENPVIPSYFEKTFEEYAQEPFTMFNVVERKFVTPCSMSLYAYLVLIKNQTDVSLSLHMTGMFVEGNSLNIDIDMYDVEGESTHENLLTVVSTIYKYSGELLNFLLEVIFHGLQFTDTYSGRIFRCPYCR